MINVVAVPFSTLINLFHAHCSHFLVCTVDEGYTALQVPFCLPKLLILQSSLSNGLAACVTGLQMVQLISVKLLKSGKPVLLFSSNIIVMCYCLSIHESCCEHITPNPIGIHFHEMVTCMQVKTVIVFTLIQLNLANQSHVPLTATQLTNSFYINKQT